MTEEWITVVEYANRRGISERQARRIVSALPEECRTSPEIRPAKVKWCPATSGQTSEESAVLGPIGADPARPGADRWPECPADVQTDVRNDFHYQALTKAFDLLQQQLAEKDRTIAEQAATIHHLTGIIDQAQQLHRSDQLERAALKQIAAPRRSWWQNAIAAWRDPKIDQ